MDFVSRAAGPFQVGDADSSRVIGVFLVPPTERFGLEGTFKGNFFPSLYDLVPF